jgi:outer membrane protein assembly factor BamB
VTKHRQHTRRVILTAARIAGGGFALVAFAAFAFEFAFGTACGLGIVGTEPLAVAPDSSASLPDTSGARDGSGPIEMTCPWTALQPGAPWPMLGGCVSRRGRTIYRGPRTKPRLVWQATVATQTPAVPTIGVGDQVAIPADVEGIVVFGPDGGRQRVIDAGPGQPANVTNTPTIGADGTFYFGAGRHVVAQSADEVRWRYDTTAEVDTSVLIDEDGTVYAGSNSSELFALHPDGGKRWEYDLGGMVSSSAALTATGLIVIGSADHFLRALDRNGSQRWAFDTRSVIESTPLIAEDGTVYIGTVASKLYALTPEGLEKWSVTAGPFPWYVLPALGWDGTIYAPSGAVLLAFNPDGTPRWRATLARQTKTGVIVDRSGTLFLGATNWLFAVNQDGTIAWDIDLGEDPIGLAIGSDSTIYVTCKGNSLRAFHE